MVETEREQTRSVEPRSEQTPAVARYIRGWVATIPASMLPMAARIVTPAALARQTAPRAIPGWIAVLGVIVILVFLGTLAFAAITIIRAVARSEEQPPVTGPTALAGATGIAISELAPSGVVQVKSELWTADAVGPAITKGRQIKVIAVKGLRLQVVEAEDEEPQTRLQS